MALKSSLAFAVVAFAVLGALLQTRQAEADLPAGEAGLVLSPNVVVSGGTFLATITAEEDDAGDQDLRFFGSDTEVVSLTEVSCTTGAGDCLVAPAPCAAPPANTVCLQWDHSALDGDGAEGPLTVVVEVEAQCDAGREFINPTAEQGATFDQDSVLCYPFDAPLFTIEKTFDGDEDEEFEFLVLTDGEGCYVSINGGAPVFVADGATFEITAGDVAGVYCGIFETTITELLADDAAFESLVCTDDVPAQDLFQISGPSVTVSFLDNFFRVFCTFENEEDEDCPCGNELDIDIDNDNNNDIGIDNDNTNNNANDNNNQSLNDNANENENDNENTNEQDQTNDQDQSNANDQTNNITSSPEVNISGVLADRKPAPSGNTGASQITPPSTGDGGLAEDGGTGAWLGLGMLVLMSTAACLACRTNR